MRLKRIFLIPVLLLGLTNFLGISAQSKLSGRVTDQKSGEPLPGATVYIPDLKTGTATDIDGRFLFTRLPSTTLLIQVSFLGYGAVIAQVDLRDTNLLYVALSEAAIESQEVVITGSGITTDNSRSSISITPIRREELLINPSTNIIDAISSVPGLSEITTGGDISKPVIRGLSSNHVVTLNEGIRQEGQQWGGEHGIEIDQYSADRIEVLKGPASLFYGSDAMGGVINILEPIHAPLNSARGEVVSQFATNNKMTNSTLMIEGNQSGFIWRGRVSYKNAASYRSPPEYVYNSGFNEINYGAMFGINKRWGYSHLHFSKYDANIGMVEGARDSATGDFIDQKGEIVTGSHLKGRKLDLPCQNVQHYKVTSVNNLILGSNQLRINLGYQLNNRREYENSTENPALFMKLNTFNADMKFTRLFGKGFEFVSGISGMAQSNVNRGDEFLIPDYTLSDIGAFLYLKKSWKLWTVNAGIRYDVRWVEGKPLYLDSLDNVATTGDTIFPGFKTSFAAFSGSAGFTFALSRVFNLKFNIGSGFRAPNIAELGSNGIHPGTIRFEIGNPTLNPENSLQIDGGISADWQWVSATFSGYYNYIFNYIYQRNLNGESIFHNGTSYLVYRFVQGNSTLKGFEFELDFHPVEQLHFENSVDYVMGTNETTDTPLPFIPALHTVHELKWTFKTTKTSVIMGPYLSIGAEIHFAQERVDTFETTTPGYFLLEASTGARIRVQNQLWRIFISGKNLTNTKYFDHLSRLKEIGVYNPGWNVTFGIVIPFGIYEK